MSNHMIEEASLLKATRLKNRESRCDKINILLQSLYIFRYQLCTLVAAKLTEYMGAVTTTLITWIHDNEFYFQYWI